ncbi:hypothetical protein [Ligilactobacillus equi]|uniref:Uncharacterized protein n=1 Tax=Ligilactobacillus equi DSM 15833 = JCM 10991 TaxID=1423740 RepID=A0A0R1TSS0_9LACO|nr:hypothetical protein [Ligilactobacillus equi]KRL84313.1 hypothetical protein FC36_GL000236 [Ligilactobacillus equi DSM 15833 = JCM 10991]
MVLFKQTKQQTPNYADRADIIQTVLRQLDEQDIIYLDFDSFTKKEGNTDAEYLNNFRFHLEYGKLFDIIFMDILVDMLNLDFEKSDLALNYFYKNEDDSRWYMVLHEPEKEYPIEDIITAADNGTIDIAEFPELKIYCI